MTTPEAAKVDAAGSSRSTPPGQTPRPSPGTPGQAYGRSRRLSGRLRKLSATAGPSGAGGSKQAARSPAPQLYPPSAAASAAPPPAANKATASTAQKAHAAESRQAWNTVRAGNFSARVIRRGPTVQLGDFASLVAAVSSTPPPFSPGPKLGPGAAKFDMYAGSKADVLEPAPQVVLASQSPRTQPFAQIGTAARPSQALSHVSAKVETPTVLSFLEDDTVLASETITSTVSSALVEAAQPVGRGRMYLESLSGKVLSGIPEMTLSKDDDLRCEAGFVGLSSDLLPQPVQETLELSAHSNVPLTKRNSTTTNFTTMGDRQSSGDFVVQGNNCNEGHLEFVPVRIPGTAIIDPKSVRECLDPNARTMAEAVQAKFLKVQSNFGSTPFEDLTAPGSDASESGSDRDEGSQMTRIALLRGLADFMKFKWNLKTPSMIISVTGGVNAMQLRPRYQQIFAAALLNATRTTNAWIITGGAREGIMGLVGDALKESGVWKAPCIAIANWGTVKGRSALQLTPEEEQEKSKLDPDSMKIRGSSKNPFRYNAKPRNGVDEGLGSEIDRNHSHYIFVDDGTQNVFGKEVEFRNELEDFISFRRDANDERISRLTEKRRQQRPDSERAIPVICLVFGGGPNTFRQMAAAKNSGKPIILVKGSGRMADLMVGWYELAQKAKMKGADQQEMARQQTAIGEASELGPDKLPEFRASLDGLAAYEQMRVFDFAAIVHRDSAVALQSGSKKDVDNPMLPVLLKTIFDSPTVDSKAKLPLAIRFNGKKHVEDVLANEGLMMREDAGSELAFDGRQLIYAAYQDSAKIVGQMLDAGFGIGQLDHLIALEIKQEMYIQELERQTTDEQLEPPPLWKQNEFQTMKVKNPGLKNQDIDRKVLAEWNTYTHEQQMDIIIKDIERPSWEKLPFAAGWSYVVVAQESNKKQLISEGSVFRQVGARGQKVHGWVPGETKLTAKDACKIVGIDAKEVELVQEGASSGKPLSGWGNVIDDVTATNLVAVGRTQASSTTWRSISRTMSMLNIEDWNSYNKERDTWVKMQFESTGWLILRRTLNDGTTACLDFKTADASSQAMKRYKKKTMGYLMYQRAEKAFRPWFQGDEGGWDDVLEKPFDPLLRIYWAISTQRDSLARVLWTRSETPFISSFFGSYVYQNQGTLIMSAEARRTAQFRKRMKAMWDAYAEEMLQCLEPGDGSFLSGETIFEEYVFFGQDQENMFLEDQNANRTYFGLLNERQKLRNRHLRSALVIMGCDSDTEVTRVDLAIMAANKSFMGHALTTSFIQRLWRRPCNNGKWLDHCTSSTPHMKFYMCIVFYAVFLVVYTLFLTNLPGPSAVERPTTVTEIVFWTWVISMFLEEIHQLRSDYEGEWLMYLKGSGNKADVIIYICFITAGICRLIGNKSAYIFMSAVLCLNLFFCALRLLGWLSVYQSVGVLIVVIRKIASKDILPFLIFVAIFIITFEISSFFFSWSLEIDHHFGQYFRMFSEIEENVFSDYELNRGVLWWDRPRDFAFVAFSILVKTLFFMLTTVILMNLLIAMMTHTFTKTYENATAEYGLVFAGLAKEFFERPILPMPLGLLEIALNWMLNPKLQQVLGPKQFLELGLGSALPANGGTALAAKKDPHRGDSGGSWGRHFTFPVTPLPEELKRASSRYRFLRQRVKAQKKLMMHAAKG